MMINTFRKSFKFPSKRFYTNARTKYVLENLKNRCLIRVVGQEVSEFLQGLITNDIKHLQNGPGSMFTMFLNTKGRILYDAIIYRCNEDNEYLIECDKEGIGSLQKQLKIYRVRRKIDITSLEDEYSIHALFNVSNLNLEDINKADNTVNDGFIVPCDKLTESLPSSSTKVYKDVMIFKDPRMISLGSRIISKKNLNVEEQLKDLVEFDKSEKSYKWFRYSLGVGEGVIDLPSGNSFPLECNCDYLHGVSFHKGCYIGQELTARTHHTGVIRKRLMPIHFIKIPNQVPTDQTIIHENENLGKLRGIEGNVGLALLRITKAMNFGEINIGDGVAKVIRPFWWPVEVSKEKISSQKT